MNQLDRDLVQAVKNLSSLSEKAVPLASAMAINRISKRATSRSSKDTAKELRVTQKLIRERARITKATVRKPVSYVRVRGHNLPAIAIGQARTQIKRRKGVLQVSAAKRNSKGRFIKRDMSGNTAIRVGRHKFENAFLQQMSNGKWHIMQRTAETRYPIKVSSIPIHEPIERNFKKHSASLMKTDMPKELKSAMSHGVRMYIRREVGRGK
ncbi:phage tail protein [Vibrio parahaemolyticus]|nr:phage tail protein [Vibrio parahaemolyticus]